MSLKVTFKLQTMIGKEERDKLQDGRKQQAQRMRSCRTGTAYYGLMEGY